MASPYLYAILSIIPGMGLFFLREYKKAFTVISLMILLGAYSFLINNDLAAEFVGYMFTFIWIFQGLYTFQIAKREFSLETRESNLRPVERVVPPLNLSLKEKNRYKWMEYIRQQLDPGENLSIGLMGVFQKWVNPFSTYQVLIGVSEKSIVFVKLDLLGSPLDVERFPLKSIERFRIERGILNNVVVFWIHGKKKPIKYGVSKKIFSNELSRLEETFSTVKR